MNSSIQQIVFPNSLQLRCCLCRPSTICHSLFFAQKVNYGAPRFKPKMLKTKPKRTPSMLALDNFDFYYGPLYGKNWPSIRLGLLTPNKFAAVINRFSMSYEINRELIQSLGTVNLIERLIEGHTSYPPKEILQMREEYDDQILQFNFSINSVRAEQCENGSEQIYEKQNQIVDLDLELKSRSESSINEFLMPTREIQHGKLDPVKKNTQLEGLDGGQNEDVQLQKESNARRIIYDSKFTITGLESVDAETFLTVEDAVIYPQELQVLIHPPMCIDGYPGPIRDKQNISSWWLLDGGSIVPVLALDLQEDDNVLDMCASPGGKSLMITQTNKFATLVCNDNKLSRLGQLRRALSMYIPADADVCSRIIIKRKDASSVESWDDIDAYDKVLADVPCTTDRLAVNEDIGNIFAPERGSERLDLPQLQTRVLINALRSVRVGGIVVYSTCSLAPTQNEMVVENAVVLARENYGIECVERSIKQMEQQLTSTGLFRFSEQQRRGSLVLPWVISNFGPMYVCKLQRIK